MKLFVLYLRRDWAQMSKLLLVAAGCLCVAQTGWGFSVLLLSLAMVAVPQVTAYLCMNARYGTNEGIEYQFSLPAPRLLPLISSMSLAGASCLTLCLLVAFLHASGLEGAARLENYKPDAFSAAHVLTALVMAVVSGCWAWLPFLVHRDGPLRKTIQIVVFSAAYIFAMAVGIPSALDGPPRGMALFWIITIPVSLAAALAGLSRFKRAGLNY